MNCRRARNLVFELIDGLADERVRAELENHLARCNECERLANQLTRSMDLVHRAPVETLDENFNWKVKLAVHRERNAMRSGAAPLDFRAWNLRYVASAAAGFVVILAVGWMAFGTGAVRIDGGPSTLLTITKQPVVDSSANEYRQPGGDVFGRRSAASPVSEGAAQRGPTTAPRKGAIEASNRPTNLDSLVRAETMNMDEAERIKYFEARLILMKQHLDACKEKQDK